MSGRHSGKWSRSDHTSSHTDSSVSSDASSSRSGCRPVRLGTQVAISGRSAIAPELIAEAAGVFVALGDRLLGTDTGRRTIAACQVG